MEYRSFGKVDFKVSALGFGCMRLPLAEAGGDPANIDEAEAIRMIRHAVDSGVNYFDTAYFYHSGQSEILLGKALKDGYRERVMVATKLPVGRVKTTEDFDVILNEQLGKLGIEKIDFYLFHGLGKQSWEQVKKLNLLEKAEAAKKAGKIGHIGFSFHDNYEAFEEIINGYDGWEFCQIQYNYMDTANQAGIKGLKLAGSKGIAVVSMEPLQGGKLANPPEEIRKLIKDSGYQGTPADIAIKWLLDQPEISLVLSGMSTMEQLEQNLVSVENSHSGMLTEAEAKLIKEIGAAYMERNKNSVPCTGCNYCMPCPQQVNIPHNFRTYNDSVMYGYSGEAKRRYTMFTRPEQRASACVSCRICEDKCPQKIAISELMGKIKETFEG